MAAKARGRATARRMLTESLAIFFGVAAALAGQALFEAHAERIVEREYLESVLQELEVAETWITMIGETAYTRREWVVQLARLLAREPESVVLDSMHRLAPRLTTYDPGLGLEPIPRNCSW